ncbi:NCS1 family nucleobase:cation symporter-1 [Veronia pacifica]|uniref:Allantoin permease n=1 Tax=Veronia pacifica TaxID=1080227 RepID=A0A1C3E9C5_9GAMM|nr:NCS1 family nucleobase:cation symporter-1 [Veronia pacifica]ODA29826.1 allantoin permease [Veronia pacifica]
MKDDLTVKNQDPTLYNEDLAPIPAKERKWGWFEIFNVWSNDVQSLFGYTLAASLFLSYGLNGWVVFAGIMIAGLFVNWLCNLVGEPSVKYGIPFPVMARASMGVRGANFPAVIRAIVAIFWYGAQTYFASTAVALLLSSLAGGNGDPVFLGMSGIDWISFLIVWGFQIWLFWNGIDWITKFLNFAGPFVYAVMIVLAVIIWVKAGGGLMSEMGTIFSGTGDYKGGTFSAFMAVVGTMIAYFAAVVINYGDFSRFVKSQDEMRKGNFVGLPLNMAFFSLIALIVTAGTVAIWGEALTSPTDIIEKVDYLPLTLLAAILFFAATVGINLVANFIPPAYDLANLMPSKINFRVGGIITSGFALVIGGLWVSTISQIGIFNFVNTLGAILAPFYGIMIVDYYMVKKGTLDVESLFSADENGKYYFDNGWNRKALIAFALPAIFSVLTVWLPSLSFLEGFSWVIGAALGGVLYYGIANNK